MCVYVCQCVCVAAQSIHGLNSSYIRNLEENQQRFITMKSGEPSLILGTIYLSKRSRCTLNHLDLGVSASRCSIFAGFTGLSSSSLLQSASPFTGLPLEKQNRNWATIGGWVFFVTWSMKKNDHWWPISQHYYGKYIYMWRERWICPTQTVMGLTPAPLLCNCCLF